MIGEARSRRASSVDRGHDGARAGRLDKRFVLNILSETNPEIETTNITNLLNIGVSPPGTFPKIEKGQMHVEDVEGHWWLELIISCSLSPKPNPDVFKAPEKKTVTYWDMGINELGRNVKIKDLQVNSPKHAFNYMFITISLHDTKVIICSRVFTLQWFILCNYFFYIWDKTS